MKTKVDKKEISIRDYPKAEREFYEDKNGDVKYIDFCMNCSGSCKQSHKINSVVRCPKKDVVHTPQEYIKEINRMGKDIGTIGKEININSRTVKSMLMENKDMSYEVYDGLDKLLFPDSKRNKKK